MPGRTASTTIAEISVFLPICEFGRLSVALEDQDAVEP